MKKTDKITIYKRFENIDILRNLFEIHIKDNLK